MNVHGDGMGILPHLEIVKILHARKAIDLNTDSWHLSNALRSEMAPVIPGQREGDVTLRADR